MGGGGFVLLSFAGTCYPGTPYCRYTNTVFFIHCYSTCCGTAYVKGNVAGNCVQGTVTPNYVSHVFIILCLVVWQEKRRLLRCGGFYVFSEMKERFLYDMTTQQAFVTMRNVLALSGTYNCGGDYTT